MYVYLNGHLVPDKAATVSVFDRGFAYGDSLIETLKILHGQPVFLKITSTGYPVPWSRPVLKRSSMRAS